MGGGRVIRCGGVCIVEEVVERMLSFLFLCLRRW